MSAFLHGLPATLLRIARYGKIIFLVAVFGYVLASMALHLSGVDGAHIMLMEEVGPGLLIVALTIVIAELGAAMVRVQLRQSGAGRNKR